MGKLALEERSGSVRFRDVCGRRKKKKKKKKKNVSACILSPLSHSFFLLEAFCYRFTNPSHQMKFFTWEKKPKPIGS